MAVNDTPKSNGAEEPLLLSRPADHPGVLVIMIDNPPVNVLNLQIYEQLYATLQDVATNDDVRVVVLTGAGRRAFVAGANLKEFAERTPETTARKSFLARRNYESIMNCPVPTIAAVNSGAYGAGLMMASVCDIVLAAEGAEFSMPEIHMGAFGGSAHLRRVLPDKVMRYMLMAGKPVSAEYLERWGFVQETQPFEKLMPRALEIADELAATDTALMRMRKEALLITEGLPLGQGYRIEQLFTGNAATHPAAQEAARNFADRRKKSPG